MLRALKEFYNNKKGFLFAFSRFTLWLFLSLQFSLNCWNWFWAADGRRFWPCA